MDRMKKEELEKLKDFKVYVFEGEVYVKAEDYKEKAIENKKLNEEIQRLKDNAMQDMKEITKLEKENKKLKDRIDVLYEFIERNDKLVDEAIDKDDLDKLVRYIYIDDDLVDRALESED